MRKKREQGGKSTEESGRLRIGDHWNAISIIALSQSNPLKAVAEFVENSIDANARNVTIVRGREKGQSFIRISDDGDGIPTNEDGVPNFKYVATHICDSIKRCLKEQGRQGIQGEFGIGLLSFWTVGEQLLLVSSGTDGKMYEMKMAKGDPTYTVCQRRRLVAEPGTQLTVKPLLTGLRHLSGEKLQWYLASELRDRIRKSHVHIRIIDRQTRTTLDVEPRQYSGRLLHRLPKTETRLGDVYTELYLTEPSASSQVGLYRSGTRVLDQLTVIDEFARTPWDSGYVQGIVDAPFLNISPGTRQGIIRDAAFAEFCDSLGPLEEQLTKIVEEQKQAEEERTNRQTLRSIQKAFREALLALPEEEYDWFDVRGAGSGSKQRQRGPEAAVFAEGEPGLALDTAATEPEPPRQREFFEHAGPLHSVSIRPASCVVQVGKPRKLKAIARDRSRRWIESDVTFLWEVAEGAGSFETTIGPDVAFVAPDEPVLARVQVTASQGELLCTGESLVTVTDSILPDKRQDSPKKGLPGYTYQNAPGALWRSRFDVENNVIVINNGHRDFVHASRNQGTKLRYICRLFAKELVYHNFPGQKADVLLERMVELSLYTEEHLR